MSSGFRPPPRPGDPTQRYVDGSFVGELFPAWGDANGTLGQLTVLRMTPAKDEFLPKDPFIIKKAIKNYLGGVDIEGGFSESNNEFYALKVRNKQHVADLRKMTQFCGINITVTDHPILNFTRSVVTCHDVKHYSDDQLLEELKDQGITAVRQFTKRVNGTTIPTGSMLMTSSGSVAPSHVRFGYFRASTRTYYPSPMLCYGCYQFGHTKTRCPSKSPVCGTCSGNHPVSQDEPCSNTMFCKRCQSSEHSLSSGKCPVYEIEDKIQHLRTDHNLSYPAAKRMYEQENPVSTAASVVRDKYGGKLEDLSSKLDVLIAEMKRKDARIVELTAENKKIQEENKKQNEDLKKENEALRCTILMLNNTIIKMNENNQLKNQPANATLTKKQLKEIRKKLEADAKNTENHSSDDTDGYTAGHSKLQRTGSHTKQTNNEETLYEVIYEGDNLDTGNRNSLLENGSSMEQDSFSSEDEDPVAKEL